jgi:tetratricopeptide (TPR) repeat protein
MLAALLLAAQPGGATAAPAVQDNEQRIVVTGVPIRDARRALEECLARHCPTSEDIAATLRYAEGLFVQGDYRSAREVLRRSIARNRDDARAHPIGVAGLFRAAARMAAHEGDGADMRTDTYNVERALRAGLAADDPRLVGARLEAADMEGSLAAQVTPDANAPRAQYRQAKRLYREAAEQARRIGRPDLAALADLRRAMLAYRIGESDARAQLEAVAATTDPAARMQRLAARIALAGMDRAAGDSAAIDRLLQQLSTMNLPRPVLLYAPAIAVPGGSTRAGSANFGGDAVPIRNMSSGMATESYDYWADVGFWIDGAGHVTDTEVLRSSGPQFWMPPVLRSIEGRIYAPAGSGAATYRVERYRLTSLLERASDTRISAHSAQPRIEMIDITNSARATSSSPAPAGS